MLWPTFQSIRSLYFQTSFLCYILFKFSKQHIVLTAYPFLCWLNHVTSQCQVYRSRKRFVISLWVTDQCSQRQTSTSKWLFHQTTFYKEKLWFEVKMRLCYQFVLTQPHVMPEYCKNRKFHLQVSFTISADEANPWKLKASKHFTLVLVMI